MNNINNQLLFHQFTGIITVASNLAGITGSAKKK